MLAASAGEWRAQRNRAPVLRLRGAGAGGVDDGAGAAAACSVVVCE